MTSSSPLPDPDAFLQEFQWLRRLALRLTGDPHDADDLAQQAWLQAAQGRHPEGSVRGWLGAIARNLHRATHRSSRRRAAREAEATNQESTPATDEIAARLDAHRCLLQAVEQLEEPYRSTITEHYLYGLSVREIAARNGVPTKTVETRLRRARERLRGRLDRDLGGHGAWIGLLGPLPVFTRPIALDAADAAPGRAAESAASTAVTTATLAVTLKTLTATGLVLVAAVLAVAFWPETESAKTPTSEDRSQTETTASTTDRIRVVTGSGAKRSDVGVAPGRVDPADPTPVASEVASLELLCLDPTGAPVAGIAFREVAGIQQGAIELMEGEPGHRLGVSGADGRLVVRAGRGMLAQLDPDHDGNDGWQLVLQPQLDVYARATAGSLRVAVVARKRTIAGTMRSRGAEPLRRAEIALVLPEDWQSRIPQVLTTGRILRFEARPDATDRFSLVVPTVPGARLRASAVAHDPLEIPLPGSDRLDLDLVLDPTDQHWTLTGRVVDEMGRGMSKILVVSESGSARSDSSGAFRLEVDAAEPPAVLHGIGEGYQPSTLAVPDPALGSEQIEGLSIVMDRPALSIRGRVLDADRSPLARARVWFEQGTDFGWNRIYPVEAEGRAAGSDLMWYSVFTDEAGRFTLDGLLDRSYRLHAAHPLTTLEVASRRMVAAGSTDVELVLDRSLARGPIEGVVVDRDGVPVGDASVAFSRTGHVLTDQTGQSYISQLRARSVTTDGQGRFSIEGLPTDHGGEIRVDAVGFTGEELTLDPGPAPAPLRVVLFKEHVVHVDLRDPELGEVVRFDDAAGEPVVVERVTSEVHYLERRVGLAEGKVTVQVSGRATHATLWSDGVQVSRVPLWFESGGPLTLRF